MTARNTAVTMPSHVGTQGDELCGPPSKRGVVVVILSLSKGKLEERGGEAGVMDMSLLRDRFGRILS